MRLKSSSSLSTSPRPSYPSDPGREPTLMSSPKTIALYSRSQHPPSLAVAQPTHSPQRVVAPHSPPYYSTSTPQPLSQEARETNCTFSFESSYRQQHHGRKTAPFSPPNYSTSTTQPLSPEAVKQTTHFRPCRATVNETQGKIEGQLQLRLKITQQVLHSPCPPSPATPTIHFLPGTATTHISKVERPPNTKAKRSRLTKSKRPLETKKVWR